MGIIDQTCLLHTLYIPSTSLVLVGVWRCLLGVLAWIHNISNEINPMTPTQIKSIVKSCPPPNMRIYFRSSIAFIHRRKFPTPTFICFSSCAMQPVSFIGFLMVWCSEPSKGRKRERNENECGERDGYLNNQIV